MDAQGTGAAAIGAAEKESLHPGEIVQGKYLVQRIVGVGGMCVVGAATNVALEQVVALKVLRRALAQHDEMVVRFMREARSAAKLKSEHVARVFDVSVLESGEPFMVMEYLEGKDLGVMLDGHGALPVADAVEYVLQACEAIGEAHASGLVHRDLKPENLFLTHRADGEAHIKVLDFGIAKAIQRTDPGLAMSGLTQDNATFGTPTYMSPEQLRDPRDVDARSDIFSLGVLLYELTSGRLPFEGNSTAELHAAILMEEPRPLYELDSAIPVEFDTIVATALAKDRFERFQNVAELARALVAFAPARAHQYADRVSRVVGSRSASLLNIEMSIEERSPSSPGSEMRTGRHRRAVRSPAPIRLTPSDSARLSLEGAAADIVRRGEGADDRSLCATLAPPSRAPSSKRGLWLASGAAGLLLVGGVLSAMILAPGRHGPAAGSADGLAASAPAAPATQASAASAPIAQASATAEATQAAPSESASASAPSSAGSPEQGRREPVRTPAAAAPPPKSTKASKPPAKADDFDPFGKRK